MLDAAGILMNNYQIVAAHMQSPTIKDAATNMTTTAISPTVTSACPSSFDGPTTSAAAAAAAAMASNNPKASEVIATSLSPELQQPEPSAPVETSLLDKHNEVTIEDLGGEENELDFTNSTLATATAGSTSTIIATDNSELSELRKRRLKFLEERNKSTSSAD